MSLEGGGGGGGGAGVFENSVRFSLNNGSMETVECIWVNIWCMLYWIIGFVTRLLKFTSLS